MADPGYAQRVAALQAIGERLDARKRAFEAAKQQYAQQRTKMDSIGRTALKWSPLWMTNWIFPEPTHLEGLGDVPEGFLPWHHRGQDLSTPAEDDWEQMPVVAPGTDAATLKLPASFSKANRATASTPEVHAYLQKHYPKEWEEAYWTPTRRWTHGTPETRKQLLAQLYAPESPTVDEQAYQSATPPEHYTRLYDQTTAAQPQKQYAFDPKYTQKLMMQAQKDPTYSKRLQALPRDARTEWSKAFTTADLEYTQGKITRDQLHDRMRQLDSIVMGAQPGQARDYFAGAKPYTGPSWAPGRLSPEQLLGSPPVANTPTQPAAPTVAKPAAKPAAPVKPPKAPIAAGMTKMQHDIKSLFKKAAVPAGRLSPEELLAPPAPPAPAQPAVPAPVEPPTAVEPPAPVEPPVQPPVQPPAQGPQPPVQPPAAPTTPQSPATTSGAQTPPQGAQQPPQQPTYGQDWIQQNRMEPEAFRQHFTQTREAIRSGTLDPSSEEGRKAIETSLFGGVAELASQHENPEQFAGQLMAKLNDDNLLDADDMARMYFTRADELGLNPQDPQSWKIFGMELPQMNDWQKLGLIAGVGALIGGLGMLIFGDGGMGSFLTALVGGGAAAWSLGAFNKWLGPGGGLGGVTPNVGGGGDQPPPVKVGPAPAGRLTPDELLNEPAAPAPGAPATNPFDAALADDGSLSSKELFDLGQNNAAQLEAMSDAQLIEAIKKADWKLRATLYGLSLLSPENQIAQAQEHGIKPELVPRLMRIYEKAFA